MPQVQRVAVTGAAGFLAGYLLRELRRRLPAADLLGVSNGLPDSQVEGVRYRPRLEPADLVFHLAGGGGPATSFDDARADLERHAGTLLDVLAQLRGSGARVVLASSHAVYGAAASPVDEDTAPCPVSPYGISKLAAEQYARVLGARFGVDARIARIANAYGPGLRRLLVYDLAVRALRGGAPLRVSGDGRQTRDYIHAADVARALWSIAERGEPQATYNVGSGRPATLSEVAAEVAVAAGLHEADVVLETSSASGVRMAYPAVARLRALGFEAQVSLHDGVVATLAWLRNALPARGHAPGPGALPP